MNENISSQTDALFTSAHNCKSTFLHAPAIKIYRVEAVGLKSSNYALKKRYGFCEYVLFGAIFLKQ